MLLLYPKRQILCHALLSGVCCPLPLRPMAQCLHIQVSWQEMVKWRMHKAPIGALRNVPPADSDRADQLRVNIVTTSRASVENKERCSHDSSLWLTKNVLPGRWKWLGRKDKDKTPNQEFKTLSIISIDS